MDYKAELRFRQAFCWIKKANKTVSLKTGQHTIAVKVVNDNGLKAIEIMRFSVSNSVWYEKNSCFYGFIICFYDFIIEADGFGIGFYAKTIKAYTKTIEAYPKIIEALVKTIETNLFKTFCLSIVG